MNVARHRGAPASGHAGYRSEGHHCNHTNSNHAKTTAAAEALVEREARRTGSRMTAYEIIAQTVGMSPDWLRKYISEKEGKEPRLTTGFNLMAMYSRVCDRVEQAGDNERKLKGEIDAAIQSISLLANGTSGAPSLTTEVADAD